MTDSATPASKRAQIVELALQGFDGPSIAAKVKLSLRQTRRYLAAPATKALLTSLEDERLRSLARRAGMLGDAAVVVLATIMRDGSEPASARVAAASRLVDVMIRLSEHTDLSERIAALEDSQSAAPAPLPWSPRSTA